MTDWPDRRKRMRNEEVKRWRDGCQYRLLSPTLCFSPFLTVPFLKNRQKQVCDYLDVFLHSFQSSVQNHFQFLSLALQNGFIDLKTVNPARVHAWMGKKMEILRQIKSRRIVERKRRSKSRIKWEKKQNKKIKKKSISPPLLFLLSPPLCFWLPFK